MNVFTGVNDSALSYLSSLIVIIPLLFNSSTKSLSKISLLMINLYGSPTKFSSLKIRLFSLSRMKLSNVDSDALIPIWEYSLPLYLKMVFVSLIPISFSIFFKISIIFYLPYLSKSSFIFVVLFWLAKLSNSSYLICV